MIGKHLGHYEILSALGKGGMGEVWRARDTKLGREVAIKTLPEEFARDSDRLARFQREATLLASLNHPNIAAIHGLEEHDSTRFLVLELVDGPTLADRIQQGPIPVEESLRIASQIAEALEAAHEKSVIHRDLKPANIKITADDKVKVLDFGLAKATAPAVDSPSVLQSPTISTPVMTQAGIILGTAAYMSPEQARGKPVDRRADIWAFGALLYEMLTGKRAFEGEDVTETLAAVAKSEPDWSAIPEEVSPPVRRVIRSCLEKDPKRRIRDIGDVRLAMDGAFSAAAPEPADTALARITWERAAWLAAVLVLVAVAAWQQLTLVPTGPVESTRLSLSPLGVQGRGFDLSPDGRRLVYTAPPDGGGAPRLWVHSLNDGQVRALPGTEGASLPFWSADGSSIGFFAGGYVKRVGADGGAVRMLCPAPSQPGGGAWSSEEVILFSGLNTIQQVAAEGGEPSTVRIPDRSRGETSLVWPSFLPDGRRYLYTARSEQGTTNIFLASLDNTADVRRIVESELISNRAVYVDPGYLVYLDRSNLLVAQPVDPDTLDATGVPVAMSSEAVHDTGGWRAFAVAGPDRLVFQTTRLSGGYDNQLTWLDRAGNVTGTLGQRGNVWSVAISPDGTRVAANRGGDIWMYDAASGVGNPSTSNPGLEFGPVWSPDSRRFAFNSLLTGTMEVFVKALEDAADGNLLLAAAGRLTLRVGDWSRDGRFLAVHASDAAAGSFDIWAYSMEGAELGDEVRTIQTRFNEIDPQFSPDGGLLAYTSDEIGEPNVYLTRFPEREGAERVSPDGGSQPRWRGDGRELYYLSRDGAVMSVAVSPGEDISFGTPEPLFRTALVQRNEGAPPVYDVTADGERFVGIVPGDPGSLSVVLNWAAELERLSMADGR